MSGFFGMVRQDGNPVSEGLVREILGEMSYRGTDAQNIWLRSNIASCFAWMQTGPVRQASQQPVVWNDRLWLWGDLRIDGQRELVEALSESESLGKENLTSEGLLLRAWAKWGPSALERVIGDFSFALWDSKDEILWCARDFFGPRPFYYAHVRGAFCFSNTLQLLRLVPEVSGELDEFFVGDFLTVGWNIEQERTVYRDIRRLRPAHLIRLSKDSCEIRRFRRLPIEEPIRLKHPEEYLEAYRACLDAAVRERLPEGPTALYLSGGLDSSIVCAVAAKMAAGRAQKEKLKVFTRSCRSIFDDPEPIFAKTTAQHLGLAQEILEQPRMRPFENAETPEVNSPEPDDDIFFAMERRFLQSIAAHANVVLTGYGGDGILTGQSWPYLVHLWQKRDWRHLTQDFGAYLWAHKRFPPLRGGFRAKMWSLLKSQDPYEGFPTWLDEDFARRTKLRERWIEFHSTSSSNEHLLHPKAYDLLQSGYWGYVLESDDASWYRVRLESRSPLLDIRLQSFLLRLPPVPWCINKEVCRQAMKNELPPAVVQRPKTPFLIDTIGMLKEGDDWFTTLPKLSPGCIDSFVNWAKWCETLNHSKGSLRGVLFRPAGLFHWLKAVENA